MALTKVLLLLFVLCNVLLVQSVPNEDDGISSPPSTRIQPRTRYDPRKERNPETRRTPRRRVVDPEEDGDHAKEIKDVQRAVHNTEKISAKNRRTGTQQARRIYRYQTEANINRNINEETLNYNRHDSPIEYQGDMSPPLEMSHTIFPQNEKNDEQHNLPEVEILAPKQSLLNTNAKTKTRHSGLHAEIHGRDQKRKLRLPGQILSSSHPVSSNPDGRTSHESIVLLENKERSQKIKHRLQGPISPSVFPSAREDQRSSHDDSVYSHNDGRSQKRKSTPQSPLFVPTNYENISEDDSFHHPDNDDRSHIRKSKPQRPHFIEASHGDDETVSQDSVVHSGDQLRSQIDKSRTQRPHLYNSFPASSNDKELSPHEGSESHNVGSFQREDNQDESFTDLSPFTAHPESNLNKNRHKKEERALLHPTRFHPAYNARPQYFEEDEEKSVPIIEDNWHGSDVLYDASEGPSQTGFPKHKNQLRGSYETIINYEGRPFGISSSAVNPETKQVSNYRSSSELADVPPFTPKLLLNKNKNAPVQDSHLVSFNSARVPSTTTTTTTTPRPQEWWSAENAKYSFSANQADGISDLSHDRMETREGGTVRGSYSYSDGYFLRTVNYIADRNGYRIVNEKSVPLNPDGPQVNPNGLAKVRADVDGHSHAYVVHGHQLPRRRKYYSPEEIEEIEAQV